MPKGTRRERLKCFRQKHNNFAHVCAGSKKVCVARSKGVSALHVLYNPTPTLIEEESSRMMEMTPENSLTPDYGLRRGILSPMETLAQSVSTMAPTTTPAATIPLVCALAGNGTWLAYVLATVAVLLVALCIADIARLFGVSRLVVYVCCDDVAALARRDGRLESAAGLYGHGIERDRRLLSLRECAAARRHGARILGRCVGHARDRRFDLDRISRREDFRAPDVVDRSDVGIGDCDCRDSAAGAPRLAWDWDQLHLHGMTGSGLRLGLVLALFSFVGFESATTLGSEARNPLKTIPRAVIQSAMLAGAFFTFVRTPKFWAFTRLARTWAQARIHARIGPSCRRAGVWIADRYRRAGEPVCRTLACITAAARVLLLMAHDGLAHDSLRATHVRNKTPSRAVVITGIAALLPVAVLAARGDSGLDVYGWMGSLATYGFIVAYALGLCRAATIFARHGVLSGPERRSFPGWLALPCCWRSSAIYIPCLRDLTANCRTSIWRT